MNKVYKCHYGTIVGGYDAVVIASDEREAKQIFKEAFSRESFSSAYISAEVIGSSDLESQLVLSDYDRPD